MSLLFYYCFIEKNHLKSMTTSILFPKNEYQRLSKRFLLCSLVIVVPLICAPILLFLYSQILVLIANFEVAKQILIQFIFLFVLLICLLDMLALVIISVVGWLYLVVIR